MAAGMVKHNLVNNILDKLSGVLDSQQMAQVETVIVMELRDYDVQRSVTALATSEEDNLSPLKKFLATKTLEGCSESTTEKYGREIAKLLYAIGKPVPEISTWDLRTYMALYKSTHTVKNSTLETMRLYASSFFSWCCDEELINRDPTRKLKRIKVEQVVKTPPSQMEITRVKLANGRSNKTELQKKRDLALLEVLYSTGARVGEVVKMRIEDVDFKEGEIVVHGKGNKQRIVYLSQTAICFLQDYLEARGAVSGALFAGIRQRTGKTGGHMTRNNVERIIREMGRAADSRLHPHALRHKIASDLLEKGMPIDQVQVLLGHSRLDTTRIYAKTKQHNVKASHARYINAA